MQLRELLDRVKTRHNLDTDYKACKILQVSQSRVSKALKRNSVPDDDLVLKAEKLLDLPEGSLLLEMYAEGSKCTEAAEILHKLSAELLGKVAAVFIMVSVTYNTMGNSAFFDFAGRVIQQHCILCKINDFLIYLFKLSHLLTPFGLFTKNTKILFFFAVSPNDNNADINNNNLWVLF